MSPVGAPRFVSEGLLKNKLKQMNL